MKTPLDRANFFDHYYPEAKRTLITLAVVVGLTVAWHVKVSAELSNMIPAKMRSVSVNSLTDLVTITERLPVDDNPFAAIGMLLGNAAAQSMAPSFERMFNEHVKEQHDLYAVAVPYRVHISIEPASPEDVARMKEESEKRTAEEAKAKVAVEDEVRAYLSSVLPLESVRMENFGDGHVGVSGTIVNKGSKTLRRVKVRFYFLDGSGRRISEKDLFPVLATTFASDNDDARLRPGYRKDFGYGFDATSGSKRVEAAIVDLNFLEK